MSSQSVAEQKCNANVNQNREKRPVISNSNLSN